MPTIQELETALRAELEPQANVERDLESTIRASIAVSLKRIADSIAGTPLKNGLLDVLFDMNCRGNN